MMAAPRSTFYPGLANPARMHWAGVPISISGPGLLLVTFVGMGLALVALALDWAHPAAYVAAIIPCYVVVWLIERIDPAICWLAASWLRHVGMSLLVGGVPGLRAVTRDPRGA